MVASSSVFLVGDVDFGGEGFFLGRALEADAVRAFVVAVSVFWIGGDFLTVDQHAEALFVKRRAGSDWVVGCKGSVNSFSDLRRGAG